MNRWKNTEKSSTQNYVCSYCGNVVAANECYYHEKPYGVKDFIYIWICPHCGRPTILFYKGYNNIVNQIPNSKYGRDIKRLPNEISNLYNEIRDAFSANCFNAVGLLSRTMLLKICISLNPNFDVHSKFIKCVEWLNENNYIPQKSTGWVDKLRSFGNKSTHELYDLTKDDAKLIIDYLQMLLTLIYEFSSENETAEG